MHGCEICGFQRGVSSLMRSYGPTSFYDVGEGFAGTRAVKNIIGSRGGCDVWLDLICS